MRNKRIFKGLEQIIETSISPKKQNPVKRVMLCSNAEIGKVDIKHTKSFFNTKTDSTVEDQCSREMGREDMVQQIQTKRIRLESSKKAWQQRKKIGDVSSNKQGISQFFQRIFCSCLQMSKNCKASNRILLSIAISQANGQREKAKKILISWVFGWIQHIFKIVSLAARKSLPLA